MIPTPTISQLVLTPMPDQRTQPSAPATQLGHEATSCSLYRSPANQVIA